MARAHPPRRRSARRWLLGPTLVLLAACSGGPSSDDDAALRSMATTRATTTTDTPSPTTDPAGCPSPALERAIATLADPRLDEVSGAVASPTRPDHIWVVEDSGNPPVLSLLDLDGATVAAWPVDGVDPTDWEDLAAIPSPPTLFVADIGDNDGIRDEVSIVRIAEPSEPESTSGTLTPDAVLRFRLPEPADAEVLLVDPRSGDVVIVTKQLSGRATVLVADGAGRSTGDEVVPLAEVGTLDLGLLSAALAGDVSSDGSSIALRTPAAVLWWPREEGETIAEALLAREPCTLPSVLDPFGEAIAVLPDGGYLLVGEGVHAALHRAG